MQCLVSSFLLDANRITFLPYPISSHHFPLYDGGPHTPGVSLLSQPVTGCSYFIGGIHLQVAWIYDCMTSSGCSVVVRLVFAELGFRVF